MVHIFFDQPKPGVHTLKITNHAVDDGDSSYNPICVAFSALALILHRYFQTTEDTSFFVSKNSLEPGWFELCVWFIKPCASRNFYFSMREALRVLVSEYSDHATLKDLSSDD